jgi:SAM-dependent methyltransferase
MKTLKEQFIFYVVAEAFKRQTQTTKLRVMDLGCGTAAYVPALMEAFPNLEYVGVEPIASSYAAAEKNLTGVKNTKIHFQLGYDFVPDEVEATFDLVFSLSVLEHIKHLDRFIALGAKYVKSGGLMVHRYDLGHALHTHSLKEKLHVLVGNNFPAILPERQFVRYVPELEVRALYEKYAVTPIDTTYHQMPNLKQLEKFFRANKGSVITDLFTWEIKYQADFKLIPVKAREKLFPAIAVWGQKL